jgi:transglutaminase-like putative cysteine protease
MRLKISHMTEYSYDEPVEFALQRLRLTPKDGPGQRVLQWQTLVSGAGRQATYEDHFGNVVELVSVVEGEKTIRIMASGEIETDERHGVYGPNIGYVPLWLYRRETPLTKPGRLLRDMAKAIPEDGDLARMHALMGMIHQTVPYTKNVTNAETTAEHAMELQAGVCQDHAHIFITVARLLGLSARYVSGYMLDGSEMAAASHAWAEAFVDGLGWVGFDPANDVCPDERYVRVAHGLDYADTAPVSGMRLGASPEMIIVSVNVEQ